MAKYTKEQILEIAAEEDVEFVRLQFTDMFGNMKNMAVTANHLEAALDGKCVFDGSAFEGFVSLEEADMFLKPDLDTFAILPWRPMQGKVARLICDVYDQEGSLYYRSSRTILKHALEEAQKLGYELDVAPECEFFMFHLNDDGIPTMVTHDRGSYFDLGPLDLGENARRDMVIALEELGYDVQSSFHEVANAQHEIDFSSVPAMQAADMIMTSRFAIRTIAKRHGLHATFMPKPKTNVHGSGLHLNMNLFKDGRDAFRDTEDPNGLSQDAYYFIGGIMKHIKGIAAITNPLVNSYKRLVTGYAAPVYVAWSAKNRGSMIRVPRNKGSFTTLELRNPDSSCNPYLAIALIFSAGLDGIKNKILPPAPVDNLLSAMTEAERQNRGIEMLPVSLNDALCEMKKDSFIDQVLGKSFVEEYYTSKAQEWSDYIKQVSEWELGRYLQI